MAEGGAAVRQLVVGIDAGIAHMSIYAAYRDSMQQPVLWSVERICPQAGKYSWEDVHGGAIAFCAKYRDVLAKAEVIALEQQMRDQFIVINATIATLFHQQYHRVHPHTMGAAYRLPRKRKPKKARTIAYVQERVQADWPGDAPKLDDLADSAMLAFYMHDFMMPKVLK